MRVRVGRRGALLVAGVLCAGAVVAQTSLPLKTDSPDVVGLTAKALIVAILSLLAVAAGLYWWRQRAFMPGQSLLKPSSETPTVEWARRISPRTSLVLVRWSGKRYLLAESANAVQVIDRADVESGST